MTMTSTTNRVLAHAETVRAAIRSGQKADGTGPVGDLEKLDRDMAITPVELFAFQQAQAKAHATGVLSTEEAMTVYAALGGDYGSSPANGGWGEDADLAIKVTVTTLMGQLVGRGR
jgi:hypothetical protein